MPANRSDRGVLSKRLARNSRKRSRRTYALQVLDSLETRVLLSYTFSLVGQTATVSPVAATGGPFLVDEVMVSGNPLLEWSQDNGTKFSLDWDSATPRVLGTNQTLMRQELDTATGKTFWSQFTSAVTGPVGSLVTLNDTSPTSDQWNMAAVEVLAD